MKKLILIALMSCALQGCIFVVGAAAGAAGAAVVYDHRKVEKIVLDKKIMMEVSDKINSVPDLKVNCRIEVTCFNQIILLVGQTATEDQRKMAEDIAKGVPDVMHVYNMLTPNGRVSALTETSDAWITAKIKTQLLATKGMQSGSIKIITENGTVYLLGVVTHEQAAIAVDVAKQVSGVQRVIKVLQYSN